jgi:two-component system, OmpR family, sensor histidine kinase KdpD
VLLLVSRKGAAGHPPAGIRLLAGFGARRTRAERARAEATALSRLAVRVLSGHGDPAALLEEIREMFGLAAVSLSPHYAPPQPNSRKSAAHEPQKR